MKGHGLNPWSFFLEVRNEEDADSQISSLAGR